MAPASELRLRSTYLRVVQHVELLGSVSAGIQQNRLRSSRVVRQEVCHIQYLSADDNPAVIFLVVLCDLLLRVRLDTALRRRRLVRGSGRRRLKYKYVS